jgi:hypothetical protein
MKYQFKSATSVKQNTGFIYQENWRFLFALFFEAGSQLALKSSYLSLSSAGIIGVYNQTRLLTLEFQLALYSVKANTHQLSEFKL